MISKINLDKVASYKIQATLETDKKVNLIYGLNGTGKSTLSNYLLQRDNEIFKNCSIEGLDESHEILVYNQTFILDNFFESENLKGIFTLSKENKDAEIKILEAEKEINELDKVKEKKTEDLKAEKNSISIKLEKAKNTVWKIKTDYSGGDRVLEFCLESHKGSKDKLFNHINTIPKPTTKPTKTIDDIKVEVQEISGENAQKYTHVPKVIISSSSLETNPLFSKVIVGNENSSVSELITKLGNSDWVKDGLEYLPDEPIEENQNCPFCQEKTISNELIESIKEYFDESYESDINSLKAYLLEYSSAINTIPEKNTYESNPKFESFKKDFEIRYTRLTKLFQSNKEKIESKIKTPSIPISLESSVKVLEDFNELIDQINASILEHNTNVDQKTTVKSNIKSKFWENMRWDYDQTINSYNTDENNSTTKSDTLNTSIEVLNDKIKELRDIISVQQKQTVNIEEAINKINNGLIDLGINDFKIEPHSENLYKIVREDNKEKVFRSLSEGEKMIISFLYFIEMCRGKQEATETGKKKIITIDDPISSLSHIYVFNIGRLIKKEFFGKKETTKDPDTGERIVNWNYKYEQVFILTHSLYFFYEITETKHDERKENQKLFRLIKNSDGSSFQNMKYEEIQNDYQAYWYIIKDEKQHPALIANCMRNVIEYFFNFVEKKDLNNFFNQEPLNSNRFQAFYRYINRESHSLGQNIFDFKEFDYNDFKDGFEELFKVAGYEEHHRKMIK